MDNSNNKQSKGLEKLEFLTDKAKRLVFQLESEDEVLFQLKEEIRKIKRKRKEFVEINRGLKSKLETLQTDREKVDERIGDLLGAIGELTIE